MATLWVRAYTLKSNIPVLLEPGADQTVTFTTSAQSTAMPAGTSYARIISDAAFHYVVGSDPHGDHGRAQGPGEYACRYRHRRRAENRRHRGRLIPSLNRKANPWPT